MRIGMVDNMIQLTILDFLQKIYPKWSIIEEQMLDEDPDPFWETIEKSELNSNLAYLEEKQKISVKWEIDGVDAVALKAKITSSGIDYLQNLVDTGKFPNTER